MKVLVVIVNYRTPDLTIDCLKSLAGELARVPGAKVVVTDNKSPDDSVAILSKAIEELGFASWCTFMPLDRNGGFAYGNNEAIKPYLQRDDKPDYVWLLNPDTIVMEGALTELIAFMDAHPAVGIGGGRAINRDETVRRSAFRFHTPLGELEGALQFGPASKALKRYVVAPGIPDQPERVDWVSGASMIVRRDVFDKVGLLDDSYFMYYEETDFCLRSARAGFECWYVPQSRIIHLVGQSSGVTGAKRGAKRRPKYWFESRARFFRNNYGWLSMHAANLFWLGGYPLGRFWQLLRGKRRDDPPKLWWDFLRYNYLPCLR
jgi:N-acetylglucosaminyl-diphospho-decaprenol L-rhamnosyltransferase